MAEIDYGQGATYASDTGEPAGTFSRMLNIGGGLLSIGLVLGLCYWGYQLIARDVSGVPVVRALEGPMRVQPDNPGGQPADHQGLAVNEVAAGGAGGAPADQVVLAPRPVDLTEDDRPVARAEASAPTGSAPRGEDGMEDEIAALVERLTENAQPLEQQTPTRLVTPETDPDTLMPAAPQAEPSPAIVTGPGVARSLRPQIRPKTLSRAAPAPAAPVELEVDPASLPDGTRLAQLGAFDSADIARSEWDRLSKKFDAYMGGKKRVIQQASSGGRTFYRLRAMGFDDLSDARRFCAVLVAAKADCIPVSAR